MSVPHTGGNFMTDLSVPFTFTATAMSDFGQGIDLLSGEARAYGAIIPSTRRTGTLNNAITRTQIVATQDDYSSLVSAVLDAQGSTLTGSFSAGFSLLEQSQMSQSSFSVVIGTTVQTKIDVIVDPSVITLTDAAANVLKTQGPAAFQAQYGTHFIGGFIQGGEYFGTINILFSSVSDQESFSAHASGSISEGLASGSVNTQVSQALSSFHSNYSLNSYVSQSGNIEKLDSADADSMISACGTFANDLKSDPSGGRRVIALGFPWSQIAQVRQILQSLGQLHALDIAVSEDVAMILRKESAALAYLARTASSLAANGSLPPIIATLARRYGTRIDAAQQRLAGLQLAQVAQMDANAANNLCQSPTISQALAILSRGKVPVAWTYALDGAFTIPILNGGGVYEASLTGDPQWIFAAPHGNNGQVATVGILCNTSGNDGFLQAAFDWNNPLNTSERGRWFGDTIDFANSDLGTVSTARWPLFNWNLGTARLL